MEDNLLEIGISLSENVNLENSFTIYLNNNIGHDFNIIGTFTNQRTAKYQIELGQTIEQTLHNLSNAFRVDYGDNFDVIFSDNVVKLKSKVPGWKYVNSNTIPVNLPILIDDVLIPISDFRIISVEFIQAESSPCGYIRVKVTANQPIAQAFVNNNSGESVNSPIYEFNWFRGTTLSLKLTNYVGTVINQNITTPPLIETASESIRVVVVNGVLGFTATVIYPYTELLVYQFSLDNINWQGSNSFFGLTQGNYTLYVRDNYGCTKQVNFTILEQNFGEPVVHISKENSFRFIEPRGYYDNDENRSFCKSTSRINYGYVQEYLSTDIITTQFKSNYDEISVVISNLTNNTQRVIVPEKLTNNIGLNAKYNQVKKYQISNSQFGIYFESGQILDYQTNSVIDNYNLNGSLPLWAALGNIIQINGVSYIIDSIGFDENVNAEVIIFNGISSNIIQDVTVSCTYNLHDYEVYEFVVDMSEFVDNEISIEIINLDPNFGEYKWRSERICIVDKLSNYLEIRYSNSTNTNIIYSTGIQHLIRIPFNTIKAADSDTNESYKTDTNTQLLNSDVYEITEFEFLPMPLEMYRKLKIALSMDQVFIDGVGYTKNSEFQKENLGSTNLYKLTAQMIKNGYVFSSNKNTYELITNENINIPGLIEINSDGYISL